MYECANDDDDEVKSPGTLADWITLKEVVMESKSRDISLGVETLRSFRLQQQGK
jgi:hypothetical protein